MIIKKFHTSEEYVYSIGGRQNDEVVNFSAFDCSLPKEKMLLISINDGSEPESPGIDIELIDGMLPDKDELTLEDLKEYSKSAQSLFTEEYKKQLEDYLHRKDEIALTVEEARALRDFLNDPKTIEKLGL